MSSMSGRLRRGRLRVRLKECQYEARNSSYSLLTLLCGLFSRPWSTLQLASRSPNGVLEPVVDLLSDIVSEKDGVNIKQRAPL
jgi:hypothetical protein